jgi:hypothetical protein
MTTKEFSALNVSKRWEKPMSNWDEFMMLPPVERRKAVARDILAAIAAKKLVSGWCYTDILDVEQVPGEGCVRTCASCAIGATIMARCSFNTSCIIQRLEDNVTQDSALGAMEEAGFTLGQATYIEDEFEKRRHIDSQPERESRLQAIWQMIADSPDGMLPGYEEE